MRQRYPVCRRVACLPHRPVLVGRLWKTLWGVETKDMAAGHDNTVYILILEFLN
jgi:hypothetical protein